MSDLMRKGATDIQARVWASIWRGDGNISETIDLPTPKMTGVSGLRVNITDIYGPPYAYVMTSMTWTKDAYVIPNPKFDIDKSYYQ